MLYNVIYKFRAELDKLSNEEKVTSRPKVRRTKASNAQRAINQVINDLKNADEIQSKSEVIILEAKVGV